MYTIQQSAWGYNLIFAGVVTKEDMLKWKEESVEILKTNTKKDFGVMVNMTNMKLLQPEVKVILEEGQRLYKEAGMFRSVVILDFVMATMQLKSIAKESGINSNERYIDGTNPNWAKMALQWVEKGIEPL